MRNFFKENVALTIGIIAPVILMLMFFAMSAVNRPMQPGKASIKYDILMQDTEYQPNLGVSGQLYVENGMLYVQFQKVDRNTGSLPKLYLYETASRKLRRLDLVPPDPNDESQFGKKILVEATKNLTLDTTTTSPDGYEFTQNNNNYYHGGVVNELFIGSYSNYENAVGLKKDDTFYRLPIVAGPYGANANMTLLGWVTGRQG